MEIPTPDLAHQRPSTLDAALAELAPVSEILAREALFGPTPEPRWSGLQWAVAGAAASIHGLAGLLALNSTWQGPPRWREFLGAQRDEIAARTTRITMLAEQIGADAEEAGIPILPLKGVALARLGLVVPGSRPTSDLDLLVMPQHAEGIAAVLRRLGYQQTEATWKHFKFDPLVPTHGAAFGEDRARTISIDLHFSIRERLAATQVDITGQLEPETLRAGINPYPSRLALMRHLLLHAAGCASTHWLRAIQLHDVATLGSQLAGADWRELASGRAGAVPWWAWPVLVLAMRYGRLEVPGDVLLALERRCPGRLRRAIHRARLCDLSASNPRIAPFPATPWSRSTWDWLRYLKVRVFPPAADLESYRNLAKQSDFARAQPWFGDSQARRAANWFFHRPVRHATVHAVEHSLSHFGDILAISNNGTRQSARPS
jgi:hypothetical protein